MQLPDKNDPAAVEYLSDEEAKRILLACAAAPGGCTEEEMDHVLKWATNVRIEAALLRLILAGSVACKPQADGDIRLWPRGPDGIAEQIHEEEADKTSPA